MRKLLVPALAGMAVLVLAGVGGAERTDTPVGVVDIYTNLGYSDAAAAGTGIILTGSGEVLTNNHVIRGATTVKATVVDTGRTYRAKVVGYALGQDVAVIQLQNASGLPVAPIGTSNGLHVGDSVTAFGNAGGVGGTPSSADGTIRGLGKSITARDDSGSTERLTGLIETDADLQPGDSGGPLVDAGGNIIGMDTAAGSTFTFATSSSRGYAIPINHAKTLAAQIVAGRTSAGVHIGPTAFMGVSVSPAGNDPFYGGDGTNGVIIGQIVPGSPMAKVGLSPGDVLTVFDGKAVDTPDRLTSLVATKVPGDTVKIRWVDQFGTAHTASIKLATGPPQ